MTVGDGIFYPFFIIHMSDVSGNYPAYVFYGSILSELIRIAKCTSKFHDFTPKAKQLLLRTMNQRANQVTLLK